MMFVGIILQVIVLNKRIVFIYTLMVCCFALLLFRVAYLGTSGYAEAAKDNFTRTLNIAETRGKIYDRNLNRLTESEEKLLSVVIPTVGAAPYLKDYMTEEDITEKLKKGLPFIIETKERINNNFIRTFSASDRYSSNQPAVHIIGYINSDGRGVYGIEKSFDEFLTHNSGKLCVTFEADRNGRILAGMDKHIKDENYSSKAGVVLSLDSEIQEITEKALQESRIKSGCAIVMKVNTGEILALASIPGFNPSAVEKSLEEENSPFLNKALCAYSPGSVFKPLVAAAALENGISADYTYKCKGEIKIGDRVFSCYNHNAHGKINMTKALEESCNTYFINLLQKTGADKLLYLSEKLGIENETVLAPSIVSAKGSLPDRASLKSKGVAANLAFGQGEILITPLKMAEIYSFLATGSYKRSSLVRGFTNYKGLLSTEKSSPEEKLISDSTVIALRKMLKSVVDNGKADKAFSELVSLSGKTGTAQSGIYKNNKEILRTWFSGFFPSGNPNYAVIVMNENGEGGNSDCAPVFRKICEGIVTR